MQKYKYYIPKRGIFNETIYQHGRKLSIVPEKTKYINFETGN
jgi:hypothetical protein